VIEDPLVLQQLPSNVSPVSTDASISVSNLSKTYRILRQDDRDSYAAEAVLKRLRGKKKKFEEFDALHDVSFEIGWGEVVGIIGRNGAGKSTLLKIINRITAPTTGRVELGGRVGSLLEVGTGFHPELTGRENVFLNGTLLGMRRKEIADRFDAIVEFAGTSRFLDTQVKRYSTGMYIRLAFAVAAHLDSEILVVDEVLAVGDSDFQAKCLRKMREVARDGRTVVLVSHQLQTVSDLCSSALYLSGGHLLLHGTVEEALEEYKRSFARSAPLLEVATHRPGTGEIRFLEAAVADDITKPAQDVVVEFTVGASPDFGSRYHLSCFINNEDGMVIAQCDSRVVDFWLDPATDAQGRLALRTPWLKPGAYTVDLYIHAGGRATDIWEQACHFQVLPVSPYPHPTTPDGTDHGVVFPDFHYSQS
jgi:lipopolysaccharide transport system ATP-binding protein